MPRDNWSLVTKIINKFKNVDASYTEIDNACDVSGRVQTLTASGAVNAGKQAVQLNLGTTVVIAATIADFSAHQGLFIVKDISTGTAAHTLTLTAGTFDGTNNKATLNAANEALVVYVDSSGNGTIVENVGSVALATT